MKASTWMLAVFVTAACTAVAPQVARTASLVEIVEVHWTHGVDGAGNPRSAIGNPTDHEPLYLWMKVKGTAEALAVLKAQGKLPLVHHWVSSLGPVRLDSAPQTPTDAIRLDIGRPDTFRPLQSELSDRGYFDWRTWSMKENLYTGLWMVRVEYANGEPVRCASSACEYAIEVR